MSNVNPNHYKVAGRERQGEGLLHESQRQKFAGIRARDRFEARQAPPAAAMNPATPEGSAEPAPEPARSAVAKARKRAAPRRKVMKAAAKSAKKAPGAKAVSKPAKKTAKKPKATAKKRSSAASSRPAAARTSIKSKAGRRTRTS